MAGLRWVDWRAPPQGATEAYPGTPQGATEEESRQAARLSPAS